MAQKKNTSKKSGKKQRSAGKPEVRSTGQFRSGGRSTKREEKETLPALTQDNEYDSFEEEEEEEGEKYMTLGDHLEELRKRILWAIGAVVIASIVSGIYSFEIHDFLIAPYRKITHNQNLILMNVYGPMEAIFKLSLLVGFVVSFPIFLYIIWGFITPALSRLARILGHIALGFSALLFWGGLAFAWFYVIPISLEFMFTDFLPMGISPQVSLERYYSFIFMLELAAGIVFQMPIVFIILGGVGILTIEFHKRIWKHVIVGIFIFSAVVTPPDPISQVMFASPLMILYFLAIIAVYLIERWKRKRQAKWEREFASS